AVLLASLAAAGMWSSPVHAACCYFSAQNMDILQPAQKVFITWDPAKLVETFTVQPKFEGNALDFGMVIPTPTQPKLSEMPRDFFKHLAVYTIMKRRESPYSKLLPLIEPRPSEDDANCPRPLRLFNERSKAAGDSKEEKRAPAIKILESGI